MPDATDLEVAILHVNNASNDLKRTIKDSIEFLEESMKKLNELINSDPMGQLGKKLND